MQLDRIEIVLDTETTGLDREKDRIVEIGCVKLVNFKVVDTYHQYINPECIISEDVIAVHGIDNEKVKDMPVFKDIAQDFLDFIGSYNIVAHNGFFDLGFLNAELTRAGFKRINSLRLIDSLSLARQKFPGQSNKLDDLCLRYNIDTSDRVLHGALLDAELLSKVYIELSGEKQRNLNLDYTKNLTLETKENLKVRIRNRGVLSIEANKLNSHMKFVADNLGDKSLWAEHYKDE